MKRNFKFVLSTILSLITLLPFLSFVQYSPSVPAGFGVDGDVIPRRSKNITSFTTTTIFDWFKPSVNCISVIDTTGAAGCTTFKPFF